MGILPRDFFDRPTPDVARALLGCKLVRQLNGSQMAGLVCETEAYQGEADLGCHARAGKTERTTVMYGAPGTLYIYFVYGMHWLMNIVTEPEGIPAAVLIRAIFPIEGLEAMAKYRPQQAYKDGWLDGPAKLTQALSLDGKMNGLDLCRQDSRLQVETGRSISESKIQVGARVGLNSVPEPWKSMPWRFMVDLHEVG
jgi:DNA-3-methyladenine glycosylase